MIVYLNIANCLFYEGIALHTCIFLVLTMNINYSCTVVFNFQPVMIKDAFIFINLQFTMYNSNYADSKFFCNVFTFFL